MALISAVGFAVPAVAQVNEILITATRRAGTTVQDVPLAVTAIGGDAAQNAGVQDIRDLQMLAPSFKFFTGQSNTAGTTAYIRGIGTGGDNPGFESAVGFFIDGVYRNRSGVALSDLPPVERIEVLRGPQGTLFGKNTSAGAISVITAGPSFDQSVYGHGTYGSFDEWDVSGGVTGPIAKDKFAVRLDADARAHDGYIEDARSSRSVNDQDRWYIRGQALWEITPDASLRLIADTSQSDEQCCGAVTLINDSTGPGAAINAILKPQIPGLVGILPPNPENHKMTITPGRDYQETVNEYGFSGELNWDLGGTHMTSITSYRNWEANRNQDIDFSDLDRAYRSGYNTGFQTTTEELRFQGKVDALDWLVGGYWAHEKLPLTDRIRLGADAAKYVDALAYAADINGPAPGGTGFEIFNTLAASSGQFWQAVLTPAVGGAAATAYANNILANAPAAGQGQQSDHFDQTTDSYALFTHDEISLGSDWMLTVGARWNHEKKDLAANLVSNSPTCVAMRTGTSAGIPNATITAAILANPAIAGLAVLECNPAVNSISDGAYSDSLTEENWTGTAALSYKPGKNSLLYASYSRGYKAGGWNLDRSGFNVTPATVVKPSTNDLQFKPEFVNAYEIGWKWASAAGTTTLNTAIFDEEVEDYQENAFSGFNFITFNVAKTISRGAEVDFATQLGKGLTLQSGVTYVDAFYDSPITVVGETLPKGSPISQVPKWSVTGALTYQGPLIGDNIGWLASIDGRWNTSYRTQTLSRNPATDNDAYSIFNARLGFGAPDGTWMLEGFVRNLTDKFYYVGSFAVPEQTSGGKGVYDVYPSLPRTWGATLRVKY